MKTEIIEYYSENKKYIGYVAYPDNEKSSLPAILVIHAWRGRDDFACRKADDLARMGYIGFAIDLYGEGKQATTDEEAEALMQPLIMRRDVLVQRLQDAFTTCLNLSNVDPNRIGVIGFCFGGLAAIELFRSGVPVKGVVTFHAVLGEKGQQVRTVPMAKNIKGSILILHGYEDPLVSATDLATTMSELNAAQVDWQLHIYGHTSHAFTNPDAHDPKKGLNYQPRSAQRAWQSMTQFFQEVL
jgi:dienelactone hydrolase